MKLPFVAQKNATYIEPFGTEKDRDAVGST